MATTPMLAATSIVMSPAVTVIDADRVGGLGGDLARLARRHVEHERGELVTAEAADHVGGAKPAAQDLRGRAQHVVAREVAGGVVDELEVVEVEQHERAVLALALHAPQLAAQSLHEPAPVEEAGQGVVVGEPAELPLGLLAVADVLDLEHVVERLAVGPAHERGAGGDPQRRAVGAEVARLAARLLGLVGLRSSRRPGTVRSASVSVMSSSSE